MKLHGGAQESEAERIKEAEREDGQPLILPSESEEAGALSSPTNGLSFGGKATDNSANVQDKEVDEQAVLFQKAGETKAPSYEERALGDAKKQILLNGLNKASETILNESYNITANGIAHAFKNHGVNGNKLNNNSIPLRKEDAALIL